MAGSARGGARRGSIWRGAARPALTRQDLQVKGTDSKGTAFQSRYGVMGPSGEVRSGEGQESCGQSSPEADRQARQDWFWQQKHRRGLVGQCRRGPDCNRFARRHGTWQDWTSVQGRGPTGTRNGNAGKIRTGMECSDLVMTVEV